MELNYKIYPANNVGEYYNIKIVAENTGAIVSNVKDEETLIISKFKADEMNPDSDTNAYYSLGSIFHGQSLDFICEC